MWNWMIHGLGGLRRLMQSLQSDGPGITTVEHDQLIDLIRKLQTLADELKQRDLEKQTPEEKYHGFD